MRLPQMTETVFREKCIMPCWTFSFGPCPVCRPGGDMVNDVSLSSAQAENIMFLELDMTPPNTASLERSTDPNQSTSGDSSPTKERGGVRKSRSW